MHEVQPATLLTLIPVLPVEYDTCQSGPHKGRAIVMMLVWKDQLLHTKDLKAAGPSPGVTQVHLLDFQLYVCRTFTSFLLVL